MKGFKFIETLEVTFKKREYDPRTGESEYTYKTAHSTAKPRPLLMLTKWGLN